MLALHATVDILALSVIKKEVRMLNKNKFIHVTYRQDYGESVFDSDIYIDEEKALEVLLDDEEFEFGWEDYVYTICIRDSVATYENWYDRAVDWGYELRKEKESEEAHISDMCNPANRQI